MDQGIGELKLYSKEGQPIQIKNTILIDYLLWDFTWDFEEAHAEERVEAVFPKFRDRPDIFFNLEKTSDTRCKLEMKREVSEKESKDPGYFLEFIITLFGYKGPLKRRIMDFQNNSISIYFNYADLGETQKAGRYWVLKCIVKMHEITFLDNEESRKQQRLISKLAEKEKYRKKFANMAYILNRDDLNGLFSGRQDYEFAVDKVLFIERTLIFADDIADKIRAKKAGREYKTVTSAGIYLNYIYTGCLEVIDKYEAIKLYLMAYHYGLNYLADECREYVLDNLDNDFVVHVLVYADMAQDYALLYEGLDYFIEKRKEVMESITWTNVIHESRLFVQNIIDSSIRKVRHELILETAMWNDILKEKSKRRALAAKKFESGEENTEKETKSVDDNGNSVQ